MERNEKNFIQKHPFLTQILLSDLLGIIFMTFFVIIHFQIYDYSINDIFTFTVIGLLGGAFFIYPIIMTLYEIYLLISKKGTDLPHVAFDFWVIFLAIIYDILYLDFFKSVDFSADWQTQLSNDATHTPVFTGASLTIGVIILIGFAGLFLLRVFPIQKMPPLVSVLSISAIYMGTLLSVIFTIQICMPEKAFMDLILLLLPVNCIIITARTVWAKVTEYKKDESRSSKIDTVPVLRACNRLLQNAKLWPIAGFILIWPLLGILIILLMLFGQAPDSVIKAFTETSQFRLSQQISPQNIYHDGHYLCTVAAGGHRKIVKPVRRGIRHGHEVIVNRQLCVANAFEQILEEHTPNLHRKIRHFYDTYGFPLAKLIHSKWIADLIWLLMKPLEWLFLIVLYLTEVHPEDRIALQYSGKGVQDFTDNIQTYHFQHL